MRILTEGMKADPAIVEPRLGINLMQDGNAVTPLNQLNGKRLEHLEMTGKRRRNDPEVAHVHDSSNMPSRKMGACLSPARLALPVQKQAIRSWRIRI